VELYASHVTVDMAFRAIYAPLAPQERISLGKLAQVERPEN